MSREHTAVQASTLVVGALPAAPSAPVRRLVAAGFIRRATGRTLTVDATGSRVTARIVKTGAGR